MLITSIIGGGSSGQTDPSGQTENNEPDSSGETGSSGGNDVAGGSSQTEEAGARGSASAGSAAASVSGSSRGEALSASGEHAHGVAIDEQASRQKGLDASMGAALRVQDMVLQSLMFTEETASPDSDLAVVSAATGTQSEPVPASEAAYREF